MVHLNSGYIGASRSVRSKEAVENFEVPLTMINKDLINNFLIEYKDNFNEEEIILLKNTTVSKWKYIANVKTGSSSWHHTSSFLTKLTITVY